MAELLDIHAGNSVLEPCAGGGALIDAVLAVEAEVSLTAYEIHEELASRLCNQHGRDDRIEIRCRDTIFCERLDLSESFGPRFDRIIGNPPYGAWQSTDRRLALKLTFPGFNIRETYALFLIRCLRVLNPNGRLVFILPSTFLNLHSHAPLRKWLLKHFRIDSIDIFPSAFFPGVAFGYADLCILNVCASLAESAHKMRLRFVDEIGQLQSEQHLRSHSIMLKQSEVSESSDCAFPSLVRKSLLNVRTHQGPRLGDIADCVTGFYSGDDARFLRVASSCVRGAKRYKLIHPGEVAQLSFGQDTVTAGIEGARAFVPILKGGGGNYWKEKAWFVDWSCRAVQHYKSDKKARFQNSKYYFKKGIGFPMVTSRRPTAAVIYESLFDQSVVGIFPKDEELFYYLLAFCNSAVFWDCLKCINPTANNSARYVAKVPVVIPAAKLLGEITKLCRVYYESISTGGERKPATEELLNKLITEGVELAARDGASTRIVA